jgi:cytochrome c oxidase subunit IV
MSDEKPEAEKAAEATATGDEPSSASANDPEGSVQTTEATPTKAEASEMQIASGGSPDEPKKKSSAKDEAKAAAAVSGSHDHGHDGDHGHGLAHTMPVWMLLGVLGALLFLTVLTVAVTAVDLGAQGNLIVAMVIATVKAILVCAFFMHLLWDKKFNLVLFLTSVLFLVLFLAMATTDRGEYQHAVDEYRAQQLAK